MAGWDSPVLADDDKKVNARRNRSLTKEEVEAFWKQRRSRRSSEEGGGELASPLSSPPATATVPTYSLNLSYHVCGLVVHLHHTVAHHDASQA